MINNREIYELIQAAAMYRIPGAYKQEYNRDEYGYAIGKFLFKTDNSGGPGPAVYIIIKLKGPDLTVFGPFDWEHKGPWAIAIQGAIEDLMSLVEKHEVKAEAKRVLHIEEQNVAIKSQVEEAKKLFT